MKSDNKYTFLNESKFNEEDMRNHETSAGIIRNGDMYLIQDHIKHNMLTFPIGKVKPPETPVQGLITEMWEELGIKINPKDCVEIFDYKKDYNFDGKNIKVHTHVFEILKYTGKIQNKEPHKHKWIKFMKLYDVVKSGRRIGDCVIEYLKRGGK